VSRKRRPVGLKSNGSWEEDERCFARQFSEDCFSLQVSFNLAFPYLGEDAKTESDPEYNIELPQTKVSPGRI
jgi:hypothetical protein